MKRKTVRKTKRRNPMKIIRTPTFRHLFTASAILFCEFAMLPTRVHAIPPQYSVTVLGSLGGSLGTTNDYAIGVNDSGQVAGVSYPTGSGQPHAVRWTGTIPADLGAGCGYWINASGQIAGYSPYGVSVQAVRWTGTTPTDLGTFGGNESEGYSINDSGQVAGLSHSTNGSQYAVVWPGTTPVGLGTFGVPQSGANAINASGLIAGWAQLTNGSRHAVVWSGTMPFDLGTLGGANSSAGGINTSGQVVGVSQTSGNGASHATLFSGPGNGHTDLGTLPGGSNSEGMAINDIGDVTGMSDTATTITNGVQDAFLYTGGKMYDLNSLLVPGSGVTGLTIYNLDVNRGNSINNRGQIAAYGIINGTQRALLLTPVQPPYVPPPIFQGYNFWWWFETHGGLLPPGSNPSDPFVSQSEALLSLAHAANNVSPQLRADVLETALQQVSQTSAMLKKEIKELKKNK
jgi:probable HAF family extracellular repeat protein